MTVHKFTARRWATVLGIETAQYTATEQQIAFFKADNPGYADEDLETVLTAMMEEGYASYVSQTTNFVQKEIMYAEPYDIDMEEAA